MVAEVLGHLRPEPGAFVVDCTIGGGGHAREILARLTPGGHLLGLDVDAIELPRTEARLRAEGHGPDILTLQHASFRHLPDVLAEAGHGRADAILVDLGVSGMQHDTAARGFSYKLPGPLDLRLDPTTGAPAADLLAHLEAPALADVLTRFADEPHAAVIAERLTATRPDTTHALERQVRQALAAVLPALPKAEIKMSVRRTFQALRIMVNDELGALDDLLAALPRCLAPGGRVVVLTFHSGEDRRVKQAFREGHRRGTYARVARTVVRSARAETFANRRAASAKLRWAIRGREA
ncbi:ribosomal RNA small subunit methyltransferase H [Luteitalea sp. TBR-22]|uniref:16S rRNA (cytosine(1402)-N(4))-methyltransferase RsmH n=1 Tax=Luteitalea sp. TBR-22 TaxID=2802971 RepID=UPI001AF784C2|nr:ribosomal RNA small subunit methyltransferase H [Luteitalea sp. TBR-22]